MSFKQIRHNAAKNRKSNGLFFSSLVIAIVAFYTLLSLGDQDVMRFLKTMESEAVSKLMLLIPIVYVISLFFVFFLVYFAYRYQLENRKKEFGIYLMVGMKRSALFVMLMTETIWNSLLSILIGLPIALLLTEIISLATAKLVGLGIIGHRISFSLSAVVGTVVGFIVVQMIAMLFLSISFSRKEPMVLLQSDSPKKQVLLYGKKGWLSLAFGLIFLVLAYVTGVMMLRRFDLIIVARILVLGGCGTFLLFHGLGILIGHKIQRKSQSQSGLYTFTGRQIQEHVIHHYKTLAISSLLLLMALMCVSFGIGVASGRGYMDGRTVDFSIEGSEQEVRKVLNSEASKSMISVYYPMYLSSMNTNIYDQNKYSWGGLSTVLANLSAPYLISETSYNSLLQSIDKTPIQLEKNQVALYTSMKDNSGFINSLDDALKHGAYIDVDNQKYELLPNVYYDNVVADRKITLYSALIVSDEDYMDWVSDCSIPFCWNVTLSQKVVNENGLINAIQMMAQNLEGTDLMYESYLDGIGRNLFYNVAASYLTIYLGLLFMIIANTVIGLKYLMQQRANKHRYLTLLMLGADVNDLCNSERTQIRLFFALALGVAGCSAVFAIWSMFASFLKFPIGTSMVKVAVTSGISAIIFVIIEWSYIRIIESISKREILAFRVTDRR